MAYSVNPLDYKIQQVIPMVYDDSLSIYELVNKTIAKLNEVVADTNAYFSQDLQTYVNDQLIARKNDGTLDTLINQQAMGNIQTQLDNIHVNVMQHGAKGDGTTDDTTAIQDAINSITVGTIYFPSGTYVISGTLNITTAIRLKGEGSAISILQPNADVTLIAIKGTSSNYIGLSNVGVEGLTITGQTSFTNDAIHLEYIARGHFSDIVINYWGGKSLYLKAVQDCIFENVYTRHCGNQTNNVPGLHMDVYDTTLTDDNVNDNKFIACTWEHNEGPLIISDGLNNNSNVFDGCKFEYDAVTGNEIPIQLSGAYRFQFDNCRYTNYAPVSMFKITNSVDINIKGSSENASDPSSFADIQDSHTIKIRVSGSHVGELSITGNTYYLEFDKLDERDNDNYIMMQESAELTSLDLRKLHYNSEGSTIVDDATASMGYAIQGSTTDGKKVAYFGLNKNPINRDGLTLYVTMKSTSQRPYDVYIRNTITTDIQTITVGTSYQTYQISVPKGLLLENSTLFILNDTGQTSANAKLSISDIWYETKFYGTSAPTSNAWDVGDIVWNETPTASGDIGWVCVTAGTPGVWKSFGTISA